MWILFRPSQKIKLNKGLGAALRRKENSCCSCYLKVEDFDRTGQTAALKEGGINEARKFMLNIMQTVC